tara:strand:- start:5342 stop:6475 length:1134 start_codon:yes stop_codon:yes gene_type:complete
MEKKMKKYVGPGFLLLSILLAFLMIINKPSAKVVEKKVNIPYVNTMMLLPQTISAQISSQGFIKPKSELNIISQLNARVEWVSEKMEESSSFNLGDTLIRLDSRDYELALITAEANVLNAEVNLEREKAESDLASKEWNRVGGGAGSALALRKPQLAQARANLEAARANLERTKRDLDRATFIAPFNGRVRSKNTDVGSTVFSGTMLGIIYSTEHFEIQLPIADQDVNFTGLDFNGLQIPDKRQLEVSINLSGQTITGKVIRAEAEVDPKTRMLSVIASVGMNESTAGNLVLVGQYAQATISGMKINDVYVIPRNNIRNQSLWVVDLNMELMNRPVNVLRYENEFALISEGIEEGDRLLLSRLSSLINGQKVTYSIN